jgi:AAA domain
MTALERFIDRLRERGCNPRQSGGQWAAKCPAHDDRKPSLSVGLGRNNNVVVKCHADTDCETEDIVAAIGLTMADLYDDTGHGHTFSTSKASIVAEYDYVDEDGNVLHRTVRRAGKKFSQCRPDGNGGWIWDLKECRRVLYRLPFVLSAAQNGATIYVVEGEKDTHALEAAGHIATCNPMGAGSWRPEYGDSLKGANVVIVADRDEDGYAHARKVAADLVGKALDVRVVQAKTGKDAYDHLVTHGHSVEEFEPVDLDAVVSQPIALGKVLKRSELSSLPKVNALVTDLLSTPATVVLVGGYGIGKTFLAVSLANSVGMGKPWLGRSVEKRRVLYILGEGAYGLDQRMTAWESANNDDHQMPDGAVTFSIQPRSLKHQPTWDAITDLAVTGGYGFIILDTFSSLAFDADEVKDSAEFMRHMSDLASAINGTVLLVHHPGWSDNSRVRGGYQLEANADEVLVATEVSKGSDIFTVLRKKVKDGPDGQIFYLRRKPHEGSVVIEETTIKSAELPMRARILAVLDNYGELGGTGPQILRELEVSDKERSSFYRTLAELVGADEVRTDGPRNATRYIRQEQSGMIM